MILLPSAARGQDRKYTEIQGTGQSLYKVAIPPVLDGGAGAKACKTLQAVMNTDMKYIGLFKVLSPKGFLADLKKEGVGIELEPWVNVGAQGVVKARAMKIGNKYSVDFYLYDVGKGKTPVLTKNYRGSKRSLRRLAHKFGNDVVFYYTKEKGIFTTKMTFATTSRRNRTSYIYVMDYDGYGVYKVSRTGRQNVLPSWSYGGAVAYTSYLWKNPDLYMVGGGGGRARRVSKRAGLNTGAAFAPNGNIALTLSKDGNAELYIISSTGKIIRRLTRNAMAIDTSPTWSPDGGQLAFVSNRGGSPQIYVMSASGGGARRSANHPRDLVVDVRAHIDRTQGGLRETGNSTDMAIQGEGLLIVRRGGEEVYTRSGAFTLNDVRELVTMSGDQVLGAGGPITLPPGEILVRNDGTILVDGAEAGRLSVVTFDDPGRLRHVGTTYFGAPDDMPAQPVAAEQVSVAQGVLEQSNVNPIDTMVGMIAAQRAFEMEAKVLQAADRTLDQAVNKLSRKA